jgi:hypothetical protein
MGSGKNNEIKRFVQFITEDVDNIWTQGSKNAKLFVFYSPSEKLYITGCRNCDAITPLLNQFKERQLLGNVYQSLCNCEVCGKYIVYDEHKFDTLGYYLANKEEIESDHKKRVRNGLHVKISYSKLDISVEPTDIIQCSPYEHKDTYGDCEIDTLYVYVGETHTDYLFDNPFPNGGGTIEYHITIDLDRKCLHHPYPESKINNYPGPVRDIFKKYISQYTK